jgi:hypothetical protein
MMEFRFYFKKNLGGEDIIAYTLKAIEFYDKDGAKAATAAFSVARSTKFLWKKRLKKEEETIS